jgi:TolB protein
MKVFQKLLLIFLISYPCFSQTQQEKPPAVGGIIEGGFQPLPVLIPGPFVENAQAAPLALELQKTLSDDLYYSDLFEVIDASPFPPFRGDVNLAPWKSSRAKYVILLKVGLAGDQINVEARFYDLQSEQRIIGKVYKWERKFMRQIAHKFGDEVLLHLWGIRGIFTSKIAFSSDRTGNREVWMMDYDGYNQRQITVSKNINLSPDLSPDGKRIAYSTYAATENIVSQVIILYSIYTGDKKTLFTKGSLNSAPAWSPDGRRIAFASNFEKYTDIYAINTDGTGLRKLTFGRSIDTSPAWNPKSGQIAFTSDRSGNPMIYVMNEDGTNEQRITYVGEYNESAAWSPDGSKLAYVSRSGAIFDIYVVMDMATGKVRRLTQNDLSNENPVWAPDSRHMAFASNRTGRYQIWSMSVDGTKLRQLTREGNNTSPSWAVGE